MRYRVAKMEDIPNLCELLNQLFSQESEFTPNIKNQTIALNKIILDDTIGNVLVAVKDKKIVGMVIILYTISTALGERVGILEDMIIDKIHRSESIGSSLMTFALDYAKDMGCARVTLLTDAQNVKAHKFYENRGFIKSQMIPFRRMM